MGVKLKPCPFCGAVPTIRGIQHKWIECVLMGRNTGVPKNVGGYHANQTIALLIT